MPGDKYDTNAAVAHLDANALPKSVGHCAKYIRLAIEAGGRSIKPYPAFAKSYGPYLTSNGFTPVSPTNYTPKKGDVAVIQNYSGGNPAGHITMFDGSIWVSDFKQHDMWSGPGYRKFKPDYMIYRP